METKRRERGRDRRRGGKETDKCKGEETEGKRWRERDRREEKKDQDIVGREGNRWP